jgi:hypothetical protein
MNSATRIWSTAVVTLGFLAMAEAAATQENTGPDLSKITEAWLNSPHADRTAEAFRHWDEEGEIPGACAVCHSSTGIIDYFGTESRTAGIIDHPVATGTVVECSTCHAPTSEQMSTILFPSGAEIEMGGASICAVCHQGRSSTESVTAATAALQDDQVSGDLGFINVHYRAAAATQMGSSARGGFQYEGKTYDGPFGHVPDLNSCVTCHNPHTTEPVAMTVCATCHANATNFSDIRTTTVDIDGDGDVKEGIAKEISAIHERLLAAIQLYAKETNSAPIVYDSHAYPYFFADKDDDGAISEGEAAFPNRYQSWTPRLLRAAYNYQYVAKDTGAFAHNPHYAIQLIHDSLENLSEVVSVDMSTLTRP